MVQKNACFARILTYCATHTLPYLCTPTGVSCLSSELFRSLSACRKGFFDTLTRFARGMRSPFLHSDTKNLRSSEASEIFGAAIQIRTGDLILTKDALYLLSYSSKLYAPL